MSCHCTHTATRLESCWCQGGILSSVSRFARILESYTIVQELVRTGVNDIQVFACLGPVLRIGVAAPAWS